MQQSMQDGVQRSAPNVPIDAGGYTRFTAHPMSPTIGAELLGIDLANDIDDESIAEIQRALLEFKVVFFRDQDLSQEQQIEFGRRFGELESHPITPEEQRHAEILTLTHDDEKPGIENAWHTDLTWRPEPSFGSILRAVQVPECGGDTVFCDMYAVYEGLPDELKEFCRTHTARHDILRTFRGRVPIEQETQMGKMFPPVEHPMVRTHPQTGRDLLFVNIAFTEEIVGVPKDVSDKLLVYLWNQADISEYQCRFRWSENSIAFWDNRACQHYAVSDYYPQVRVMDRVTITGDAPFLRNDAPPSPHRQFGPYLKGPAVTPQILDLIRTLSSDDRRTP